MTEHQEATQTEPVPPPAAGVEPEPIPAAAVPGAASGTEPAQPEPAPAAASSLVKRLRLLLDDTSESTKRLMFIGGGVLLLIVSVLGFVLTADAFDGRNPALVAARPIEPGEILPAADLTSEMAQLGTIPHVQWDPDLPALLEGLVAAQPIAAGSLISFEMFVEAEEVATGGDLVVEVPLDLSLVTAEVSDGETVLLVDPGVEPIPGDDGRPRQVVRAFELANFDGARMRLVLPPEQWAEWTALLEALDATLMVKDLGFSDPQETARNLDEVWLAQWSAAVGEVAAAEAAAQPSAGPGELEVIVSLDASLVPSGVSDGDLVLLIDPGVPPAGGEPGRARSVIQFLTLENYSDGRMQMFVPPDEWVWWRSLPERLGGDPQVLPVPDGTDIDQMIESLDAEWEVAWRNAILTAVAS